MQIGVIGAGYVGLVSAACFSEFGADVTCFEVDAERLAMLKAGVVPIREPGLQQLIDRNLAAGRLRFVAGGDARLAACDVIFIAVGTPMNGAEDGVDLSHVHTAVRDIACALDAHRRTVIVAKSTVPIGTSRKLERLIAEARPDLRPGRDFHTASNPEFLREGFAVEDFSHPDRIVIGTASDHARQMLEALYHPFSLREVPILLTDRDTAETIKYASNAFLAVKISFINEMADLCERVGADVGGLATGMGTDPRIGLRFLVPGPGYGGSCLPKDTAALSAIAGHHGVALRVADAAQAANRARREGLADRVGAALGGTVAGMRIAILGLTFKAGTADLREAVSLTLVPELICRGAEIRAFDPTVDAAMRGRPEFAGVAFAASEWDAIENADAMVVLTDWSEFRGMEPGRIFRALARPVVVDMRNIFDARRAREAGLHLFAVGVPPGEAQADAGSGGGQASQRS